MNKYDVDETLVENLKSFFCYWRLNIHRFCIEYLGVRVHLFQQILLYLMDAPQCKTLTSFIFFASRGLGKSFLTMLFCIAKCILYPNITIKVASSTIKQAISFAKKINEIKNGRPNIENEIEDISITKDGALITFKNGSTIEAVVCSENARGARCNILILDESRLMDVNLVNDVLRPFLTKTDRGQLWATSDEYRKYAKEEHNSVLYLTSIGYKDEWSYKDFLKYLEYIRNGDDDYFAVSLPYQFGIEAGVIDDSYIEKQMKENKSDLSTAKMEFEVIPKGESENAMFSYEQINRSRKLIVPLIPPTDEEYIRCRGDLKSLKTYQPKEPNEIRLLSMDIAISAGRSNDNSVITLFRLYNQGDHYLKEVAYIETMNGINLDPQILRLKQIFYDLECDYAVIDAGGAIGIQASATCGKITRDIVRNKQYAGWKTVNNVEKFDVRVADPNAEPVLYCIQVAGANATTVQYNMLVNAQLNFERNQILLLSSKENGIDELNKRFGYMKYATSNEHVDKSIALNMVTPFINTSELVKECLETQVIKLPSGKCQFDEGNGRKDRVICMMYGLYIIDLLEQDLSFQKTKVNVNGYFKGKTKGYSRNVVSPFTNNINKLQGFGARR